MSKSTSIDPFVLSIAPALMALALGMFAAVTVGSAHAQVTCTEANGKGCVELSAAPPQNTTAVPPNIVLMVDDSGSMDRTYMPDWNYLSYNTQTYLINSNNNMIYYDPTQLYPPPPKADGSSYTSYTDITSVPVDGFVGTNHKNLTEYTETIKYYGHYGKTFRFATGPVNSSQTVHYVVPSGHSCASYSNCVDADDTSGAAAPPGVRVGTNIANWFAYYHTRMLLTKSGIMRAFDTLSPNYRVGFASINAKARGDIPNPYYTFNNKSSGGGHSYNRLAMVKPFGEASDTSSRRHELWKWLLADYASGNTPLRLSLKGIGEYYKSQSQPWEMMPGDPGFDPAGSNSTKLACRSSYAIFMTDGFWNGSSPSVGNQDSGKGQPFQDAYSNTLADVAWKYWETDLQPGITDDVPATPEDPATWQHMTTFTVGLGFEPVEYDGGPVVDMDKVFQWARTGVQPAGMGSFSWPQPGSNDVENIADLAHAGVNGHGDFFSARSPQELADSFAKAIAQISARNVVSPISSSNSTVAVLGALGFTTGYSTGDWTGTLEAVQTNTGATKWDAGAQLDAMSYLSRKIFTAVYHDTSVDCSAWPISSGGKFASGAVFSATTSFDCAQKTGLLSPALDPADSNDTLVNRIDFIRGDTTLEGTTFRDRAHILGAIMKSDPVYVSFPRTGFEDHKWPAGSPEETAASSGSGYYDFQASNRTREGTVYVAANDGMLHAFASPAPVCDFSNPASITCNFPSGGGVERWAFIPRAVYRNLGNLTEKSFKYRPTVDATPVTMDVYSDAKSTWRTVLVGGVGLGGRGVYALDITKPKTFSQTDVMWEFDADMALSGCVSNEGSCKASDLGYTVPQLAIGRIANGGEANGDWVVLAPNGYFPDCTQPDVPTNEPESAAKPLCEAIASQAPRYGSGDPYSSLFVINVNSGDVIAELKTPQGTPSYGLGSVVMGDYGSDQIADVAFAGDLRGNLWRFDLTDPNPSNWQVTLAFKGGAVTGTPNPGIQPITAKPRLFPEAGGFMVVFGTGKYLGAGDNSTTTTQSLYAIHEDRTSPAALDRSDLLPRDLAETAGTGPLAGGTARTITDPSSNGFQIGSADGWYVDFDVIDGERVVVSPGAIFLTNTVAAQSLIPNMSNACDPTLKGAQMFLDASNGGGSTGSEPVTPGGTNAFLVGGRITQAATSGTVPIIEALGGGSIMVPVQYDTGGGSGPGSPGPGAGPSPEVSYPVWRRRSWSILKPSN